MTLTSCFLQHAYPFEKRHMYSQRKKFLKTRDNEIIEKDVSEHKTGKKIQLKMYICNWGFTC